MSPTNRNWLHHVGGFLTIIKNFFSLTYVLSVYFSSHQEIMLALSYLYWWIFDVLFIYSYLNLFEPSSHTLLYVIWYKNNISATIYITPNILSARGIEWEQMFLKSSNFKDSHLASMGIWNVTYVERLRKVDSSMNCCPSRNDVSLVYCFA